MEMSIVVEDNHHQHSNSNLGSKSMESSIKIDSISIDLVSANEKSDSEKCEHFSIRGYVSEIRKKDWKICWPFASDGNNNKDEEQTCVLPPLHVPKFRSWRCQNCQRENANDYGRVLKSCHTGFNSNSICSHAPILADAAMLLSDFHQGPNLDIPEGRQVDANDSANLNNTTEYHPSSCIDKKEKKTEVVKGPIIGDNMGVEENVNPDIHRLSDVATEVISSCRPQAYNSDDKAFKPKCNGSINLCEPSCQDDIVVDAEFAENLNCTVKNAGKIFETEKETPVNDQHKELIGRGTSGEADSVEETLSADKDHVGSHPTLKLDESDNASSENAEILAGSDLQDLHHDNSTGLLRRKTRKVRLLTDLLCENVDGDTDNIRTDHSLSTAIPDASEGVNKLLAPLGHVAIQGNVRRGIGQNRKRKLLQNEDWRPMETSSPNKVYKEVRILKRDVETSNSVAGFEAEEDVIARIGLQTGMKSHCTKHRIDKIPVTVKKKNKKTTISDECLALAPSPENLPNAAGEKIGDASNGNAVDGVLSKTMHNAFTGREIELFPLTAQEMERKPNSSNICKRKSKIPQVYDQQASPIPCYPGMIREGQMTMKDVEIMYTGTPTVPFHSAHDLPSENELNLSLNSCQATERYNSSYIPQVEYRKNSLFPCQEGTSKDHIMKKVVENHDGNFRTASISAVDAPFGKGHNDLSSKRPTCTLPFFSEKQNYTPKFEMGGCSLIQQKDFYSTSYNDKTIASQQQSAVTRKDNCQRADKVPEQGVLDDIPMEIVELMAKNQYERCLADAEYDKRQLETTNTIKLSQTTEISTVHGNSKWSFFQQETGQKQKPWAKHGRNGVSKGVENLGPFKQKAVDYFSRVDRNQFNVSQLEQTHPPARFGAFLYHQEKTSSGVQHSASSPSRQNSAQHCKWVGDMTGTRFSYPSLQASGPCNSYQSIPLQGNEANHLLSCMMPNCPPFLCGITQKNAAPSTNIDAISDSPGSMCKKYMNAAPPTNINTLSHSPGDMHEKNMDEDHALKFLNQNAANLRQQNGKFASETLSRTHTENPSACKHNAIELNQKPMGSLDLYSNETIPAMHLLSLMDAGVRSNAPITMNATPKFHERSLAVHKDDPKEFSRLESGAYKATNAMTCLPYAYHGKNKVAQNSHDPVFAIPTTVGATTSSFQHNKSFKRATNSISQVPQEKEKRKGFNLRAQDKGCKSQKFELTSGGFGTNCGSVPVHTMQTVFFGDSDSMVSPLQYHSSENSMKHKLVSPSCIGAVHPHRGRVEMEKCSVNRNPADFSIPDAGNEYMIKGEDLKFDKEVPPSNWSRLVKADGQKRRRKLPAIKNADNI